MALNIFNIFFATAAVAAAVQPMPAVKKAAPAVQSSAQVRVVKAAQVVHRKDTVIVRMRNGKKMVLVSPSGDFGDLKTYDFNRLMFNLDSLYRARPQAGRSAQLHDTLMQLYLRRTPGTPITPSTPGAPDEIVTIDVQRRNGRRGNNEEYRFDSRLYQVQIDTITEDGRRVRTIRVLRLPANTQLRQERTVIAENSRATHTITVGKPSRKRTTQRLDLNLGLNTYLVDGQKAVSSNAPYTLRPIGSRYISIRGLQQTRLGEAGSRHHLVYGLELAWNNFMFDSENVIVKQNGKTDFQPYPGVTNLEKSKLVVCNLNVPVMYYYEVPRGLRFGIGGFGGLRLDSYSKVKFSEDGNTERRRNHNNFNLNDFQYGVRAQIGFREVDLFCNYHLSPLFNKSSGMPDVRTVSFGIEF